MRLFICIVLLISSSFNAIYGLDKSVNSRKDSLINAVNMTSGVKKVLAINDLSLLYLNSNIDSSMYYLSIGLMEAKRCGDNSAYFEAYFGLASIYVRIGSNNEAIEYFTKAIALSDYSVNKEEVVLSHKYIAFAYRNINQYPIAIDHLYEAAIVANEIDRFDIEGDVYISLARFYRDISNFQKSLECGLKALDIFTKHGLTDLYATAYRSIAAVHREQSDLVLAEDYYNKARILLEKENNPIKLVDLYIELAIFYDVKGDFEKCIAFNYKSLELAKLIKDERRSSAIRCNLGFALFNAGHYSESIVFNEEILANPNSFNRIEDKLGVVLLLANAWMKLGNTQKAEKYIEEFKPYLTSVVSLQLIREFYNVMAEIAYSKGKHNEVYRYKTLELQYADSISKNNQNKVLLEMQMRFETNQQKFEIDMLKMENKEQQKRGYLYLAFGVFFVLVSLIIAFFAVLNKKKTRQLKSYNKELEVMNAKLHTSEDKLKALNATKDKLFSIIGHDLKNPFNAMLGFCEMLNVSYNQCSEEQYKSYINVVYDSGRSIYNLLDNLLQWSKMQVGKIVYKPIMLNLELTINDEKYLLTPNASNKNIEIAVEIESNEVVFADQYTVSIIIRNLISNALKFTPIGGKIRITVKHLLDKKMVEVAVIDNGVGMTEDEMDQLFKVNGAYTTKGTANETGTGLGLMLCKEFVENNGGKIWVISQKGKGSEFHFTLPVTSV